jgi:hypothetical protein
MIFFDLSLSDPDGQSCASCHDPKAGFSDPNHAAISPGISKGLFGNRNAPSISYAHFSTKRYFDSREQTFVGGFFLDGRVNSMQDQIKKTLFNPLEMNNKDLKKLVAKIKKASFYPAFIKLYGSKQTNKQILDNLAEAIVSYEKTIDVNPFTSKFDYYLKGKVKLSKIEMQGMQLFKDENKAKCANCHLLKKDRKAGKVLFTDYTYDNIGVPKNDKNPYYTLSLNYNSKGLKYIDLGLGETTKSKEENGKFKVPTLRNIEVTAPYFHNGVFNTLEEVVHFYNKRDVDSKIKGPECAENLNIDEVGDLKLTKQEEKALVAFMKTLTDGYKMPKKEKL